MLKNYLNGAIHVLEGILLQINFYNSLQFQFLFKFRFSSEERTLIVIKRNNILCVTHQVQAVEMSHDTRLSYHVINFCLGFQFTNINDL